MAAATSTHPVCRIPPVLTSATSLWKGVRVEQMQVPPLELPEHQNPEYLIRLHRGAPLWLQWKGSGPRRRSRLLPGDVCVVPADAPRELAWHHDAEFIRVLLAPPVLRRVAEQTGTDANLLAEHYGVADPLMEHLILALLAEAQNGYAGGSLFAESLGTALAVHLLRRYSGSPSVLADTPLDPAGSGLAPAALQQATDYLQDHLAADVTLADLAATAGNSPAYFCTLFKRATGMPPHRYLLSLRVERAAQLLRRGNLTISHVAAEVGFADQSHLTRHMKRLLGVTPGALLPPKRRE